MKIYHGKGNQHSTIADDSPEAIKIREGYNFRMGPEGVIIIKGMYTEPKNKWQFIVEAKKTNDVPSLKSLLIKILESMN